MLNFLKNSKRLLKIPKMRHTLKLIKKVEFKILKNNFTSKNAMWKGFKSITYQHTADRIKINIIHNREITNPE